MTLLELGALLDPMEQVFGVKFSERRLESWYEELGYLESTAIRRAVTDCIHRKARFPSLMELEDTALQYHHAKQQTLENSVHPSNHIYAKFLLNMFAVGRDGVTTVLKSACEGKPPAVVEIMCRMAERFGNAERSET